MNDLISKVTPLTRSIIWLTGPSISFSSESYKAVDYLLNGLLTASLKAQPEVNSRVIFSENFGHPLHVFITKEIVTSEYESFLKLLRKDVTQESGILVIDESASFQSLLQMSPEDIRSRLHLAK